MNKITIIGMTLEEMERLMNAIGQPTYRAKQLFNWVYKRGIISPLEITNFSLALKQQLDEIASIGALALKKQLKSADNQTIKFLFQLQDGLYVESVFMVDGKRRTVCVSSQVGCPLKCRFCATGRMGFQRNLTAGEIVDQLLTIQRTLKITATNVVIMGMGEPLLNYDAVVTACQLIAHDKGVAIGRRKITISTAGIIPALIRFTDEQQPFKLAISLNAADEEKRSQLMPINNTYPLKDLMQAARYYASRSKQRITFEYVMIAGVNDGLDDAARLCQLIKDFRCKINIIPYNPINNQDTIPSEESINAFMRPFLKLNVVISVRRSKGVDIDAACGQLYHRYQETQSSP